MLYVVVIITMLHLDTTASAAVDLEEKEAHKAVEHTRIGRPTIKTMGFLTGILCSNFVLQKNT